MLIDLKYYVVFPAFFSFFFVVSPTKKVSHFIIHYWHFSPENSPPKNTCLLELSQNEFVNLLQFSFFSCFLFCLSFVLLLFIVESRQQCCFGCIVATSNGKRMDWYHFAWFFRALKTIYVCVFFLFILVDSFNFKCYLPNVENWISFLELTAAFYVCRCIIDKLNRSLYGFQWKQKNISLFIRFVSIFSATIKESTTIERERKNWLPIKNSVYEIFENGYALISREKFIRNSL